MLYANDHASQTSTLINDDPCTIAAWSNVSENTLQQIASELDAGFDQAANYLQDDIEFSYEDNPLYNTLHEAVS